jgi:hypothetical protein
VAVAFSTSSSGKDETGTNNTATAPSVNGNVTNPCVIAVVTYRNNAGQTITGVTHDGNAMTQIGSTVSSGGGSVGMFYRVGTSTTGSVIATLSANTLGIHCMALVFSGVNQASPIGTEATSNSGGSDVTTTSTAAVTSAVDGMCVDGVFCRAAATLITADGGQTEQEAESTAGSVFGRASYEAGAASVTMGWTWTGATRYGHIVAPLQAAAGGSAIAALSNHLQRMLQMT